MKYSIRILRKMRGGLLSSQNAIWLLTIYYFGRCPFWLSSWPRTKIMDRSTEYIGMPPWKYSNLGAQRLNRVDMYGTNLIPMVKFGGQWPPGSYAYGHAHNSVVDIIITHMVLRTCSYISPTKEASTQPRSLFVHSWVFETSNLYILLALHVHKCAHVPHNLYLVRTLSNYAEQSGMKI